MKTPFWGVFSATLFMADGRGFETEGKFANRQMMPVPSGVTRSFKQRIIEETTVVDFSTGFVWKFSLTGVRPLTLL